MRIKQIVENNNFQHFIIGVIVLNGIILGLETVNSLSPQTHAILQWADQACLAIFIIELTMKLIAFRGSFFKDGWNIFDFVIVAIALIPATGELSILRAFRIFRLLRLISTVNSIRRVVSGMLIAIPGVGSVGILLLIFFYIGAVIGTSIFGPLFPEWFGGIDRSMYTLFQIMTLESWSMGIVRPVMAEFPYAWLFFIPFIMVTTFMVLNLFIGIIVDAMATVKEHEHPERYQKPVTHEDIEHIKQQLDSLSLQLEKLNTK